MPLKRRKTPKKLRKIDENRPKTAFFWNFCPKTTKFWGLRRDFLKVLVRWLSTLTNVIDSRTCLLEILSKMALELTRIWWQESMSSIGICRRRWWRSPSGRWRARRWWRCCTGRTRCGSASTICPRPEIETFLCERGLFTYGKVLQSRRKS